MSNGSREAARQRRFGPSKFVDAVVAAFVVAFVVVGALGVAQDLAAAGPASGVGFDPARLGLRATAWYAKDAEGRLLERSGRLDPSVAVSQPPTPAEFDARWGAGSFLRWRWKGTANELEISTVANAMRWAFDNRPEMLGLTAGSDRFAAWTGEPTQRELIDASATGYSLALVKAFAVAEWPGTTPERAIEVRDPARPLGARWHEKNPYWPVNTYFVNIARATTPQVPDPPVAPTPPPSCFEVWVPEQRVNYRPGLMSTGISYTIRYELIPRECQ